MATNLMCMGCMQPLAEDVDKCPHCGYPVGGVNPPEYLKIRTLLSGRYLVGRVLEIGGDSAVYIAYDKQEEGVITLREFYPATLCTRTASGALQAKDGHEATFAAYRSKFLSVARAVARLRDVLVVVPSYDIFEENGTAYTVAEFCKGQSLEKYVAAKGGRLSFDEVRRLFLPLLSALSTIHATGLLHLGISPKNILMDNEGNLRLKNFAIPETRTVNTKCKPNLIAGYAAPEQYEAGADCTPATDVYGVAASMLFALTGHHPADAQQRGKKADDLMMPADIAEKTPQHVKDSLIRALRVHEPRRTQTVQQLLDEMTATSAVAALIHEEEEEEEPPRKGGAQYLWIIFVAAIAVMAVVMVLVLDRLQVIHLGGETTTTTTTQSPLTMTTTSTTEFSTTGTGEALFEVEDFKGQAYADAKRGKLPGDMTMQVSGYQFSSVVPRGNIVSQTPAAGEKVNRGSVISVVISAGPMTGAMPDVTGWKEEHAKLYLEALGYKVAESLPLQVSTFDKGLVERSSPKAGAEISVGDTVTLYVSNVEQENELPGGITVMPEE
ncbi:MAG: PASTA domain-containing protein [Clostridia bacterium]|nr:PASTA domain-containing protein [Clostridia bacterium]